MRISVVAVGTRGDVEPHLALAARLSARGHQVTLAAPIDFAERTLALGLGFHRISVAFRHLYDTPEGADLLGSARRPFQFMRRLKRVVVPLAEQVIHDVRGACSGADVVCYSMLGLPAHYVARDLGIPSVSTYLQPIGRTRFAPSPLYSSRIRLPGAANLMTHRIGEQLFWQLCRPLMRANLETTLPTWGHFSELYQTGAPMLFAYSPLLVPRPADFESWMHVSGFWSLPLESGWRPPAALADFLSAGPPPVCIGFGSMNSGRIDAILPRIRQAIAETGRRAIILTGWWEQRCGAELAGDDVFVTEAAPHSWLFPRVAAVVHHGGAGTTAAALTAGVPSIVMPFFFDQWFWGNCLSRLRLGPDPISGRALSVRSIRHALEDVVSSSVLRQRLAHLGRQLRKEDGAGNACDVIEDACDGRGAKPLRAVAV